MGLWIALIEGWLWERDPDWRVRWVNRIFGVIWMLAMMALLLGVMTLVLWGGAQH